MKLKNVALLVAALTCIAGSTALAAEKVNIKSSNADSYDVVQVMTTKDKDYYQYYNSAYQYAVDIPRSATAADMTTDGAFTLGCAVSATAASSPRHWSGA